MPGPPFVFGSLMVILAIAVAMFIPEGQTKRRQDVSDSDLIDLQNPHLQGLASGQTLTPLLSPSIL